MEEEDPSTRKILEARRINFSLGIHAEVFVSVVNSKERIKDQSLPTEWTATIFVWFVTSTRIFLAKTVYMLLSHLTSLNIFTIFLSLNINFIIQYSRN